MNTLSKFIVIFVSLVLLNACGSGKSNDTLITKEEITIFILQRGEPLTVQDYLDFGILNVNDENIDEVNKTVINLTLKDYTLRELQTIIDDTIESNVVIENPTAIQLHITLNGEHNITLTKEDPYIEAGAIAKDSKGNALSHDIKITGNVDTTKVGNYILTYTISSGKNTASIIRNVHVVNQETNEVIPIEPTITLNGEHNITLTTRATYNEAGARATDGKGNDLTDNINIEGEVNTTKSGNYILTYSIKNNLGHTASVSRNITVVFPWEHGDLKVSNDNRSLQHSNGRGFFWMADTAWDLYKNTDANITLYMDDRAQKKFTVIQALAMYHAETWSNHQMAFNDRNLSRDPKDGNLSEPNEKYWEHIDYLINAAKERGMYVALLPVWHDAIGQKTFQTPADATLYGTWIANRYKEYPNIIWVIGGDTTVEGNRGSADRKHLSKEERTTFEISIWDALGSAINSVDSNHLITFHPTQRTPSIIFGNPDWLDFNMLQSARGSIDESIRYVKEALEEGLAVVDGESLYENLVYGENPKIEIQDMKRTPFQMREDAYSQLFVGAFGNTYGHTAIYRFWGKNATWEGERCPKPGICTPAMLWIDAIHAPGSKQMQYVTELMQSRPIVGRVPAQSLLVDTPSAKDGIVATRGNGYAMVYSSHGENFTVNMAQISGSSIRSSWYNPKNGENTIIGEFPNTGTKEFNPPGEPTDDIRDGNDWVLILDDISRGFPVSGS